MKPAESQQIEFIKDCLRKGEQRKIILVKFGAKWGKTSKNTFDRRLSKATAAMQTEMDAIKEKTNESIGREVEARKLKIMTSFERQEFLSKVITASTDIKKIGNQAFPLLEYPDGRKEIITLADKLKALAELNKMGGDYAPTKIDATIKEVSIRFKDAS